MTRPSVVVGVDGGGTTTEVLVAEIDGEAGPGAIIGRAVGGPSNWELVGLGPMAAEVAAAVDAALSDAGSNRADVAAAAFGMAGVDWPNDVATVGEALATAGLAWPRVVVNDAFIALRAGAANSWGIVSSVGTGAVAAGIDRAGRSFRTMAVGWGEPSGASSLARDAVHAVAAAYHRTGPATALTDALLAELDQQSVSELFEAISRRRLRVGPGLAPLVTAAAHAGDAVAVDLVTASAERHAAMVTGVADHLGFGDGAFDLVTSGGVHRSGGLWSERFAEVIRRECPTAVPSPLQVSPAVGALRMAVDRMRDGVPGRG